mmetsp:Transcript_12254/g.17428  ORF Transcript_12254/g.17428 Transcript_12254/m.17428 type:complete len:209 (+) Transcript_12254:280-906(+)
MFQMNIESGEGRGNIEGNTMFLGGNGQLIGPNFVRRIAIGADAICTHHAGIGALGPHEGCGGRIADQGSIGHLLFQDFEGRESTSLIVGTRLECRYAFQFVQFLERPSNAQRRSVSRRGQGSCIANGHHSYLFVTIVTIVINITIVSKKNIGTMCTNGLIVAYISFEHEFCMCPYGLEYIVLRSITLLGMNDRGEFVQGIEQIDSRWT